MDPNAAEILAEARLKEISLGFWQGLSSAGGLHHFRFSNSRNRRRLSMNVLVTPITHSLNQFWFDRNVAGFNGGPLHFLFFTLSTHPLNRWRIARRQGGWAKWLLHSHHALRHAISLLLVSIMGLADCQFRLHHTGA
jgi:hypothetical protein